MHSSSCPKCGQTFDGETKTCGSCGAVSRTFFCLSHRLITLPPYHDAHILAPIICLVYVV
ncbi:hypothetical protein GGR53DRAFT_485837 [Hypoxylon sp. FL1150]|nr:hypothetical protein GGR53DRAFT_485837 [Hypoxylon sp. FL1150]